MSLPALWASEPDVFESAIELQRDREAERQQQQAALAAKALARERKASQVADRALAAFVDRIVGGLPWAEVAERNGYSGGPAAQTMVTRSFGSDVLRAHGPRRRARSTGRGAINHQSASLLDRTVKPIFSQRA